MSIASGCGPGEHPPQLPPAAAVQENSSQRQVASEAAQEQPPQPTSAVETVAVEFVPSATSAKVVLKLPVDEACVEEETCFDRVGVHYKIPGALWGPQAMYVDAESRFWICDSPAGRLVAFDATGKLVDRIPYTHAGLGHVLGFAVTPTEAWFVAVGEQANSGTLVRALNRSGEIVASMTFESDVTLMVPGRARLFLYGGLGDSQVFVPRVSAGAIALDPVPSRVPFKFACDGEQHRGRLDTGTRSVSFTGCFNPLRLNADGSLDSYLKFGGSRAVVRFGADGAPLAAVTPPAPGYGIDIGFTHAAAGPRGEVYAVVPRRKIFEIVELGWPR